MVGPWITLLNTTASRLPLDVNAYGSSLDLTTPSSRIASSRLRPLNGPLESSAPLSTSSGDASGPSSTSTLAPATHPSGLPSPCKSRFTPSRPMTRDMVAVPLVPALIGFLLRKPGGYFRTKATSPGASRPVHPLRNSNGQMRLYGMATLVPSLGRLPCESLGTLMSRSGATTGRPRNAGRLLGTVVGLPCSVRLTPVCGTSEGAVAPTRDIWNAHGASRASASLPLYRAAACALSGHACTES